MRRFASQFGAAVLAVFLFLLGFHLVQRARIGRHLNAAFLVEGLSAAGAVKVAVLEYYQEYGEMPSSNEDVGLPPPWEFVGRALRGIEIIEGGGIVLTYGEESGVDQGQIYLVPSFDNPTLNSWTCTTPSYRRISKLIPQCEYDAG